MGGPSRNLSTREAARILGMREAAIRDIVRSGLCRPARRGRGYAFSFQDLVVLRTAQGLLRARVPAARVRRALAALARQLPAERPLSGMRVYADGRDVAVCEDGAAWQPETGQTVFQFEVDELRRRVERVQAEDARRDGAAEDGDAAERARRVFERAIDLEEDDREAARAAYARAVAIDPALADAWVNLGRLAHEAGDAREAARLYHRALALAEDDAVVHYNLALALEDTKGSEAALAHYRRAVELDPGFADAHYNLAGLCEQLGRGAEALRHYRAYQKLTEG